MLTKRLHVLRILGKKEDKKDIIAQLQHLGVLHLRKADLPQPFTNDTVLPEIDEISKLLLHLNFLMEQGNLKKDFHLEGLPDYEKVKTQAQDFIDRHLSKVKSITEEKKDLEAYLKEKHGQLLSLNKIPFSFKIPQSKKLKLFIFKSQKNININFSADIRHIFKKKTHYYAITIAQKQEEKFLKYIKESPLKMIDVSFVLGSSIYEKNKLKLLLNEGKRKQKELEKELFKKLNGKESKLAFFTAVLENYYEQAKVSSLFKQSKHLFALEGYIEGKDIKKVKQALPELMITARPSVKNAPTKLSNNSYSKTYELITKLFAMPSYRAVDPTLLISFFFPFFFGIMLSDVGYGIALLALVALLKYKFGEESAIARKIFFWSALSSMFFGFIFGSFFGNLVQIPALYTDSFSASFTILIASLIIGLIHLNLAVGLNIYQMFANKKGLEEVFIKVAPFPLVQIAVLAIYLEQTFVSIITVTLAVLILLKEKSIFGIMDISGYFGTWFSYARLLALSLATSGVALAVNVMAEKTLAFGIPGLLLSILIIIFGHTFNFALNILGCSIHAARLHYVEFFSFFYDGEGHPFKPFKIKTHGGKE